MNWLSSIRWAICSLLAGRCLSPVRSTALLLPLVKASNLWAAFFLAATIASLWYLPHSNFAARLLYEDQTRGQQTASPLKLQNYLRYFPYIYEDHFGKLAFWLIVPAALLPWLRSLWRRVVRGGQSLNAEALLLWLSLLSSLLILSMLSQRNPRNLVPLLPAVAVLFTLGLRAYPKKIAAGLGACLDRSYWPFSGACSPLAGQADFYRTSSSAVGFIGVCGSAEQRCHRRRILDRAGGP